MKLHHLTHHTKRIKKLAYFVAIVTSLYFFSTGQMYYALGDIFFGQVAPLYNVTLAEFFFNRAAHPFIGRPAPYAFHQLSRTHFIQGDLLSAIREAKEEVVIYPDHTATYYIIGLTYGYIGRKELALDAFTHYIETHSSTWAGRNDKAWLQFQSGDIDGALTTILPAYAMYPDNPWVLNTYGVLLMNKGRYIEAKEILTKGSALARSLSEESWGKAYPGNDPRVYKTGLEAMQQSFKDNLHLIEEKLHGKPKAI